MIAHFLKYFVVNIINILLSYALLAYFSNELTKPDYAEFGYYSSVAGLFFILVNLGHKETLFKYASQNRIKVLSKVINSSIFVTLFWSFVVFLFSWWHSNLLFFSLLSTVVGNSVAAMAMVYRGRSYYFKDAIILPAQRFLWLLFSFLSEVLHGELTVENIFLCAVMSGLIVLFISAKKSFYHRLFSSKPTLFFTKDKTILSFIAVELVTVVYSRIDMIVLHGISDDKSGLADYFFAIQMYDAILLLLAPISFIFFNAINKKDNRAVVAFWFLKCAGVLIVVVLSGLACWLLFGHSILEILFSHFTSAFHMISFFIIVSLFSGLHMIGSRALFAKHLEARYVSIHVIALLLYLSCLPIWFDYSGFTGVVLGRALTELLICLLITGVLLRKQTRANLKKT